MGVPDKTTRLRALQSVNAWMVFVPLAFFRRWPSSQMTISKLGTSLRRSACLRNIS